MRLKDGLKFWTIGNDVVIIEGDSKNINLSNVYVLNSTSAYLFEELKDKDFTLESICDILCNQFNVDRKLAASDALYFIDNLLLYGFLQLNGVSKKSNYDDAKSIL